MFNSFFVIWSESITTNICLEYFIFKHHHYFIFSAIMNVVSTVEYCPQQQSDEGGNNLHPTIESNTRIVASIGSSFLPYPSTRFPASSAETVQSNVVTSSSNNNNAADTSATAPKQVTVPSNFSKGGVTTTTTTNNTYKSKRIFKVY